MPGRVLKILVIEGQHVANGDALVILEAMKMEQVIRAARGGVVARIVVKPGDQVSPGDELIQIEGQAE
jgi:biotin carboxyl carrier protein